MNQSPFSAQYDRLGYGRIEIFTKPGQDNWHGRMFSLFNTSDLDSRNPFAAETPSYHRDFIDGNIGGLLGNKTSVNLDCGRRNMTSDSVISAVVLDSSFQQTSLNQAARNPQTNDNFSGRLDRQL